jgi:hypothetical protein
LNFRCKQTGEIFKQLRRCCKHVFDQREAIDSIFFLFPFLTIEHTSFLFSPQTQHTFVDLVGVKLIEHMFTTSSQLFEYFSRLFTPEVQYLCKNVLILTRFAPKNKSSPIYLGPKNLNTFWCTGWAWNCQIIFRCASIHGRAGFILCELTRALYGIKCVLRIF